MLCSSSLFNSTPTTQIYPLSLHDALPICVFTQKQLTPAAKVIDQATNGAISKLLESEFKAKKNTHIVLRQLPNVKAQRVVVIGVGESEKYNTKTHFEAEKCFSQY